MHQGIPRRKGKSIFSGLVVQLSVIYAHAQTAILLFNEHDGGGIGAAALSNYLCLQELVNMLLDYLVL